MISRLKDKLFYGWVVVATCFMVGTAIWGMRFSFGVFFKSIEGEFSLNRAGTSAIFSVYMALSGVCAAAGGWALDRYGPRFLLLSMGLATGLGLALTSQINSLWQLFLTYSLLVAIGSGPLYTLIMSTVSRWFDKKRGLALGIAGSGMGLSIVVMTPLATYLISTFDWRMAYVIIGVAITSVVVPLSWLIKKDPHEIGALPDGIKREPADADSQKNNKNNARPTALSLSQALKTRSFWLIMLAWVLLSSTLFLVLTHLVPHITDMSFSPAEAAAVLTLFGITTVAGRIILGGLSDKIGHKVAVIYGTLIQAGAMVWLVQSQDLWMFYLFASVYGLTFGGISTSIVPLVVDSFGVRHLGIIFGVLDTSYGAGAALGPVIGGLIFDARRSYSMAFLMGAVAMLAVTLLLSSVRQEVGRIEG